MPVAIITGSGTHALPGLDARTPRACETPFGAVEVSAGELAGVDVLHVSRHGAGHVRLSSQLDQRGYIWALHELGAVAVIGCTACGAVDPTLELGSLVVFDDLHFISNRLPDGSLCTFFTEPGDGRRGHWVLHGGPFSDGLRAALVDAAARTGHPARDGGTYGHVDGPRFNTPSEIATLAACGVTAVSQTGGSRGGAVRRARAAVRTDRVRDRLRQRGRAGRPDPGADPARADARAAPGSSPTCSPPPSERSRPRRRRRPGRCCGSSRPERVARVSGLSGPARVLVMARAPGSGLAHPALEPLLGAERCVEVERVLVERAIAWGEEVAPGGVHVDRGLAGAAEGDVEAATIAAGEGARMAARRGGDDWRGRGGQDGRCGRGPVRRRPRPAPDRVARSAPLAPRPRGGRPRRPRRRLRRLVRTGVRRRLLSGGAGPLAARAARGLRRGVARAARR